MFEQLMTLREIAQYAGVRASAVSNWKRRHPDFPTPAQVTSTGTLYRSEEVVHWLTEHDKVDLTPEEMGTVNTWESTATFMIAQMLRESSPEAVRRIILSVLLHTSISRGPLLQWAGRSPQERRIPLSIPTEASTQALIDRLGIGAAESASEQSDAEESDGADFVIALREAWQRCEDDNPALAGLLQRADIESVQPALVAILVHAFDDIAREGQSLDLDPIHRVLWDEIAPFEAGSADDATPSGLARLLFLLANGSGPTLLDLAAGRGHLVFDAIVERWRSQSPESHGDASPATEPDEASLEAWQHFVAKNAWTDAELVDPDAEALTEARIWSLIYDIPITVQQGRVGEPLSIQAPVDMVLVDCPMHARGVDIMSLSPEAIRWLHDNAGGDLELGFITVASRALAATGRAAIAVSTHVLTSRSPRIREVRGELINSGLVEAVVALPGNLHRGVSRPISVIVLRGRSKNGPILLVDSSTAGTQRRRTRELNEGEVDSIAGVVLDWRRDGTVGNLDFARSVAVDPVDLEDHVLDAALYLAPPKLPDAHDAQARVDLLVAELTEVSARLGSTLGHVVGRTS